MKIIEKIKEQGSLKETYKNISSSNDIFSYLFFGNFLEDSLSYDKQAMFYNHKEFHIKRKLLKIKEFKDLEIKEEELSEIIDNIKASRYFKQDINKIEKDLLEIQNYFNLNEYTDIEEYFEDKLFFKCLSDLYIELQEI